MRIILSLILSVAICASASSQSFWFGPRGGLSIGTQQGGAVGQQPLIGYNAGFFMETLDEDKETGSLYANLGLHQRGNATRRFISSVQNITVPGLSFRYNNVVLEAGAKKFYNEKFYYKVGIRGEYTAFTNLEEISSRFNSLYYPLPDFIRPLTGGITIGGGYQYELAELYGVSIEANIMPDFFNQYTSPAIPNVVNPITGQATTIRAQQIRNTTFEITVAMRFLRKVIYID